MPPPRLLLQTTLGEGDNDFMDIMEFGSELEFIDDGIVFQLQAATESDSSDIMNYIQPPSVLNQYHTRIGIGVEREFQTYMFYNVKLKDMIEQVDANGTVTLLSTVYSAYAKIPKSNFTRHVRQKLRSFPGGDYIYGYVELNFGFDNLRDPPQGWNEALDGRPISLVMDLTELLLYPQGKPNAKFNILNPGQFKYEVKDDNRVNVFLNPHFFNLRVYSFRRITQTIRSLYPDKRLKSRIKLIKPETWWLRDNGKYHDARLNIFMDNLYSNGGYVYLFDIFGYDKDYLDKAYVQIVNDDGKLIVKFIESSIETYKQNKWILHFSLPKMIENLPWEPGVLGTLQMIKDNEPIDTYLAFMQYQIHVHPLEGKRLRDLFNIPLTEEDEKRAFKRIKTRHGMRRYYSFGSQDLPELPGDVQDYIVRFVFQSLLHD